MGTLKPQSNAPLFRNTVIGTLVVDGWAVTFGTARRDWAGQQPSQAPPRCTKCNSPPINDQCTKFILFDVALLPLYFKGLTILHAVPRFLRICFLTDDKVSMG